MEEKYNKSDKSKETSKENESEEVGGRKGLDPVRYGDWEKDGRCVDF